MTPRSVSQYSIRQLLPSASFVGCGDILFRDVCCDSRQAGPGDLFVAVPGGQAHGNQFASQAMTAGANGILTDTPLAIPNAPQCVVSDVRRTYGWLCQYLAGQPANSLKTIGVTGTNGKTSVTWLLRAILNASGCRAGLLGTIECDDARNRPEPSRMTTPDPCQLARWLQRMARNRATHAVMEVSSHALHQKRIAGLTFQSVLMTNITHDHLDYHQTIEQYQSAKCSLVDYCHPDGQLIINADDPAIAQGLSRLNTTQIPITVGLSSHAQHRIWIDQMDLSGSRFRVKLLNQEMEFFIRRPGEFNVLNAAMAAVTASYHGCSEQQIAQTLAQCEFPPGRLQVIPNQLGIDCFVDYAHTPDAIEKILQTVRPLVAGELICVLGAGGNRDREKRPLMARAAAKADRVILTSDNPRRESPEQILQDLQAGLPADRTSDSIVADRKTAIDTAILESRPGDCVLILGKGHETVQEIGNTVLHFSDAEIARACCDSQLIASAIRA
ncbi:MAG: UDP-N-acetylmuramoyl-L-alanyl-D-glutamate--2,6-diaminopimelate ligase [Planctomycetaceae bacterium]|nr:UDP-N-acetylmuramoyl-L-alanyl-D-glutamate--2,6-diaminopimelate ligase [Planctomycetaceae bacterium]